MPTTFYTSPFGEATGYPWISKADTKYHPDGLFHVVLGVDPSEEAEKFHAMVTKAAEDYLEEVRSALPAGEAKKWSLYNPVVAEEDQEGNPTGRLLATFKQNRVIKFRDKVSGELVTKTVAIGVKDGSGTKDVRKPVFGGSEIRVMFTMRPSKITSSKQAGVRLDFALVQVKKLASSGGSGARFGAVDDGYHADELDERDQANFDPADDKPVHGADY